MQNRRQNRKMAKKLSCKIDRRPPQKQHTVSPRFVAEGIDARDPASIRRGWKRWGEGMKRNGEWARLPKLEHEFAWIDCAKWLVQGKKRGEVEIVRPRQLEKETMCTKAHLTETHATQMANSTRL
jgi:hypothetical protein